MSKMKNTEILEELKSIDNMVRGAEKRIHTLVDGFLIDNPHFFKSNKIYFKLYKNLKKASVNIIRLKNKLSQVLSVD